jgi:hypothetical protein
LARFVRRDWSMANAPTSDWRQAARSTMNSRQELLVRPTAGSAVDVDGASNNNQGAAHVRPTTAS